MRILRFAQHLGCTVGIDPEALTKKTLFNHRNVAALVVLNLSTILSLTYLLLDANTFLEYTYGVAAFSSMLVATAIFAIFVWKTRCLFYCLGLMEKAVANS